MMVIAHAIQGVAFSLFPMQTKTVKQIVAKAWDTYALKFII